VAITQINESRNSSGFLRMQYHTVEHYWAESTFRAEYHELLWMNQCEVHNPKPTAFARENISLDRGQT